MTREKLATDLVMSLISENRIVRLTKTVEFIQLPRIGEEIEVRLERGHQDFRFLFRFHVVRLVHCEGENPLLSILAASNVNGRAQHRFWLSEELDEWIASFKKEGWQIQCDRSNTKIVETDELDDPFR